MTIASDSKPDYRCALATLGCELRQGGWVGALAGALLACALDPTPSTVLAAAVGCSAAGLLCGVLLWLQSADFPEEIIPPVSLPPVTPLP
jgi:hypothetical protein